MDPGVGPAGPVDRLADPVAEARQCRLEFSLDCPDPRPLELEPGEVRAVVFDPSPEPTSRPNPGDTLSSAWWVVQLDELDLDDRRRVTAARADLHDPGVAG
jgi:hypothetical protein